ncbi:MAG: sigma-70 family RNA polymerase sigma factor [Acidobacteriota bacterium]|nr:sigma-70 family RNA polymerase sigma factor [Acidobacteriota bacterium]
MNTESGRFSRDAGDDERELVIAAQSGDVNAFECLVTRYERRLFRLAWNITQDRFDAEDAVQEAFLSAFKHLKTFEGNSRFYTWLVRIAINHALMKVRKRRGREVSLDEPAEEQESVAPREIADWGPTPEEYVERAELNEILMRAIAELSVPLRTVFQLRDVEGFSTRQTAETLGLSVPATKTRLLNARLKLRDKLQKHFRTRQALRKGHLSGRRERCNGSGALSPARAACRRSRRSSALSEETSSRT